MTHNASPRGPGFDRRPIIIIDGRNYKRSALLPPPSPTARRLTAKQSAAIWLWCGLELATVALFFVAGGLWAVLARGAGW